MGRGPSPLALKQPRLKVTGDKLSPPLSMLLAGAGRVRLEITGSNDHEFLRIDVLAQRGDDLLRRQGLDLFLQFGLESHGPARVAQVSKDTNKRAVARAADLLRL